MTNYNASLKYKQTDGKVRAFGLWVMEYTQDHQLAGESSQSKMYKHYYSRSYAPGALSVSGRVRTQYRYDQLGEFIRAHHELLVRNAGYSNAGTRYQLPLMKLAIPFENMYVDGWIVNFEAGAKRFNVAPEYRFDFVAVKDNHSLNSDMHPASVLRSWWSGAAIDAGEIHNEVDVDLVEGTIYDPYSDPTSGKSG